MSSFTRRAFGAMALAFPAVARAQGTGPGGWPSRPVRVIVPFPPGGSNDAVARPLAEHLQGKFGQPFVVENRPGAGSTIGSAEVVRSPADGLTLMVTSSTFATSGATQRTPYDPAADFEAVAMLAAAPLVILAAPGFPPGNMAELVAYLRANPGKVDYGSAGPGSINHLSAELFAQKAGGVQMQHVPYRGMGPATTDLAAGTIQLLFTTLPSARGVISSGRVKVLGWTGENRPPSGPQAPTPRESGLPDYQASIWWGLLARRGTPPEIRAALNAAANEALSGGRLATYLESEGAAPTPLSPAEGEAFLQRDLAQWKQVASTANIRIE
ncbi:tripartite tricarboxylate transporter substrate binding protein [Roseomonas sp. SSH11]|uniref:Tripartite tricarboxylate transporter substrate binding protein n=1 Tax=Pararoseomonas baculiformis TaxID=2820812 RepID=A0ABS4AHG9_9PROT|nr:tripartite tricarboxylate transporter substrate-binding protein [Pararoseomonas baculiformis]MBP0445975.1 tripartite tricarboxylate transporter substrate binding protein [Pararoseomonas baculiformis]